MHAAIAFSAVIAFVASAVSAAPAAACNPSYNVAPSTPCFLGCNVAAGQQYVPGWTMDNTSPLFLDSLKLMCTKGTPEYTGFMTAAGTCMMTCSGDDPALFFAEFSNACAWYAAHKDDTC
ncbi:hypothetical protein BDF21DRAFT_398695 [Thamnidium elegans]|uniref:Uncharacterized protein n=1 Tax=Thamnidium elegans TaxID=101142 RepID=A0A8H7W2G6_9FUNG|nr:hypothetical protein INT48_006110 [Thamnidium elegans]KAI8081015.1 hypothetical protein BDF21DRAFT_398695 [Thamnidium elegans]